jgi:GT2 family glycosyltransferase
MKNGCKASVIVLGYNGKDFLERCLASVVDQSYPAENYEIIYADNGSKDDSADFVSKRFPNIRVVRFHENLGFSEGYNQASKFAQGRYLVFLNQDTVAHQQWLAEMVNAMEEHEPEAKACHAVGCPLYTDVERQKPIESGYISEITRYGTVEPFKLSLSRREPIPTLHLGGGSMILDSEVINELGYIFDTFLFAYCEDLDLGLRLNGLGYKVLFVPKAVCYHHREGRAELSKLTIKRTIMATRNRFLVYMKNMYTDEFLISLPYLFVGTVNKMGHMVANPVKKFIYALGLIPFTTLCLSIAIAKLPLYRGDRQRILARRLKHHDHFWLRNELRNRGISFTADL